MSILYQKEHLSCLNYDGRDKAAVSLQNIASAQIFAGQSLLSEIVFVLKGEVSYCCGQIKDLCLKQGQILLILPGCAFSFTAGDESQLMLFRVNEEIQFCECYQLETLMNQTLRKKGHPLVTACSEPFLLTMDSRMQSYVSLLAMCMGEGLRCHYYLKLKIKELFYMLRAFYPKEELAMFFRGAVGYDSYFSHYILNNHHKYSSVSSLAAAMNSSLSGFEKRFKTVFGKPPYKWMTEQKAKKIFYTLNTEDTPLKELSQRFGFASKSTFSDFCKKHLHHTPAAIRRRETASFREDSKNKIAGSQNRGSKKKP